MNHYRNFHFPVSSRVMHYLFILSLFELWVGLFTLSAPTRNAQEIDWKGTVSQWREFGTSRTGTTLKLTAGIVYLETPLPFSSLCARENKLLAHHISSTQPATVLTHVTEQTIPETCHILSEHTFGKGSIPDHVHSDIALRRRSAMMWRWN